MQESVLAFDVETTGKKPDYDQIVEIAVWLYGPGDARHEYHSYVRPGVSITPGAERVHGISEASLSDAPPFADIVDEVEALFRGCDVVLGYNVRFDISFLEQEFARLGRSLDLSEKLVVDPFRIWTAQEPRRLENAVARFAGRALEDAHSASADAEVVFDVLQGMRREFELEEANWDELAALTAPETDSWIGPSHHVRWEGDVAVMGFGKYDGRSLHELARIDAGYLGWIQSADFPPHVKSICKGAVSGISDDAFHARLRQFFGGPTPKGAQ